MSKHRAWLSSLLLAGCGASSVPIADGGPAAQPTARSAPEQPPAATTTAPPTDAILQAALTDERFAMYLHPDVPGRIPVVLSGPARPATAGFELFGAPAISKDADALVEGEAFVEITQLSVEGDRAAVKLRYPIEGVVASFSLTRAEGLWSVTDTEIVEQ